MDKKLNKEQILHDISIAYMLYRNTISSDSFLSFEDFFQEYENVKLNFEPIIDHYHQD